MHLINALMIKVLLLFMACTFTVQAMAADAVPNEANIPRGQDINPVPNKTLPPTLNKGLPTKQAPRSAVKLTVKQFNITGNKAIKEADLLMVLTSYLDKEVGMAELNAATQTITQYYREQGYLLAQAYLPTQDVNKGIVTIAVLEGSRGDFSLTNTEQLNHDFLASMASYRFPNRAIVREQNLVRNTTIINSLPAVRASANLNPGQVIGSSDIELSLETISSDAYIALNTYGNRFTGREQLIAGTNLRNIAGVGDLLNIGVKYAKDNGHKALSLAYIRPVHASGTLLSTYYSYVDYKLGGQFADLDAEGDGHYASIYLDQPLERTATYGITGRFGLGFKDVEDTVGNAIRNKRDVSNVEIGFVGDWINPESQTYYQWGLSATAGHVDFKDDNAAFNDKNSLKTAGGYSKLNANFTRQQFFTNNWQLMLNADYQLADQNLDSVEKMAIGGINRWRAFSALPNQADAGAMLALELRKNVNIGTKLALAKFELLSPYVFVEYGRGKSNQNPLTGNNRIISRQYGVGVDMLLQDHWSLMFALSAQERAIEGADGEYETRLWGQLKKSF